MHFLLGLTLAALAVARPNIILILTDDQDDHMQSMQHMPLTQKYLVHEGTTFHHHYCTVAICCPSRVNLWTGQAAHNTNVTDVNPPYGGYPKFVSQGYNEDFLPLWMQQAGYNTYYSGKLFNAHTTDNYNNPPVNGFTGSEFLLDPFTYQYYNASMTRNGEPPINYAGLYSPDLTASKAYGFLDEALSDPTTPFFLTVAPIAPHADVELYPTIKAGPPQSAPRHAHLFTDYRIPRTENFNPDSPSGVSWVAQLPQLNSTQIEYNDEYQRQRLRSLQSVDEMVENIVHQLAAAGALDSTFIFYTTDNGYHISQHRMHPGKECGFETDIRVPLVVRGPGIAPGGHTFSVSSHTDLAPTIMSLAGNRLRESFDGEPMDLFQNFDGHATTEHVGVEFWGLGVPEGRYGYKGELGFGDGVSTAYANNTYKGLRLVAEEYSLYYSVWCTNEAELYDMKNDPGQLDNLLTTDKNAMDLLLGRPLDQVRSRLDALLMVVKSCRGDSCRHPWRVIHPQGNVHTLLDALDEGYDYFYARQPRVSFSKCELGYILSSEGPQSGLVYGEDYQQQNYHGQHVIDSDWSLWT